MALVTGGTFDDIADVLVFDYQPLAYITAFTGFTETVSGEVPPSREFERKFRYSTDGGYTFTAWDDLTNPNLAAIVADDTLLYYFQVRYERIGTDGTGTLTWTQIDITATVNLSAVVTFFPLIFKQPSIFGNYAVNDQVYQELCGNLLDKIKAYGIIPQYVERTDDFIHFWETTCCYFALHYLLANRLANIYTDKPLLRDYLRQRGVFLCGTETLPQLQTIAADYYEKMRYRGTQNVLPEIQRLICSCDCCEFIFAYINNFDANWVVDRSSPLFRSGVQTIESLNKFPEDERYGNVVDLGNYMKVNAGNVSIITTPDNEGVNKDMMRLYNPLGSAGIKSLGLVDSPNFTAKLDYLPDPQHTDPIWNMNYEISFRAKQISGGRISFGVECFDCDGVIINDALLGVDTGLPTIYFFQNQEINTNKFEHIRGMIFGENNPSPIPLMRSGYGQNLIPNPAVTAVTPIKYIYPRITVLNLMGTADYYLYDFKCGLVSLPYGLSFLGVTNFIAGFINNGNGQLTTVEIEEMIKRYLIPLNTNLNIVNIS